MQAVFIKFTDEKGNEVKKYSTCSLKTGTMDNIFDIAERAEKLEKENMGISEVKTFYNDLKATILAVFHYQFSLEQLNEGVEQEELMKVFKDICSNISGELRKN